MKTKTDGSKCDTFEAEFYKGVRADMNQEIIDAGSDAATRRQCRAKRLDIATQLMAGLLAAHRPWPLDGWVAYTVAAVSAADCLLAELDKEPAP